MCMAEWQSTRRRTFRAQKSAISRQRYRHRAIRDASAKLRLGYASREGLPGHEAPAIVPGRMAPQVGS